MDLHTNMKQIKVTIHKPRSERLLESIRSGKISFIWTLLSQGCSPNGDSNDSKAKHPLDLAIQLGNHEIVSLLIEFGANLDLPVIPLTKQIALHRAVIRGDMKIITTILERTANWKDVDVDGATVLHLAMESREHNHIEILKVFLDLGMDVDVKTLKGETPLFVAGKNHLREVIDFLIERGANVNVQDCNGDSLIHYFLKYKSEFGGWSCTNFRINKQPHSNVDFIEWLISKGVDVDRKNKADQSPFQLASQYPMASALLMLLKYMKDSLDITDEKSRTLLHSILEFNSCENFRKDIRYLDPDQINQLETVIDILISKGIPVDTVDQDGNSILHVAVNKKRFFIIPKLLEYLADVNARNSQGETAMYLLIKNYGLEGVLRVPLSSGAEMNIVNNDGLSSVHLASKMRYVSVLKMFKEKGADLKVCTSRCENLWHMFASNEYNANSNSDDTVEIAARRALQHCTLNMVELLANENLDINAASLSGSTPLHVALNNCNFDIVGELVKNGADVNLREKSSQLMPIHIAVQKNYSMTVEYLLGSGADVNATVFSLSPLHLAARHCGRSVIKTLIRMGADVDALDEENRKPLHYVICNKNFEAFVYFLEIGVSDCFDVPLETFFNCSSLDADIHAIKYMIKYECIDMPLRNLWKIIDRSSSRAGRGIHLLDIYKKEMIQEADKMKELCHETSLYDFLHTSLRRRTFQVKQGNFARIIDTLASKNEFPIYRDMIMYKYQEALTRTSLLIPAKDSFSRLIHSSLPDLCIENILDYLSNITLKVLIKVNNDSQSDWSSDDEILTFYPDCKRNLYQSLISDDTKKRKFHFD